jgi:hypothetical protein
MAKEKLNMRSEAPSQRGFGKAGAVFLLLFMALMVAAFFARPLRRYVRESLMQSVTSAHYRILCPPGALSQDAMTQFALHREPLFTSLNAKLNDVASNAEIHVIFDPEFKANPAAVASQLYEVTGTTVRSTLHGRVPELDPAADAEALLHIAWGHPGNPMVARWTARWLVSGQAQELGMAAAQVEQKIGHKKVENLLGQPQAPAISSEDRELLGAAWINAIAEFGGAANVRKLYSAKTKSPQLAEVSKTLSTTPTELERKWQMWMYAYIAGMPPANPSMNMPTDMPMSK